jgi:hypothetical protein
VAALAARVAVYDSAYVRPRTTEAAAQATICTRSTAPTALTFASPTPTGIIGRYGSSLVDVARPNPVLSVPAKLYDPKARSVDWLAAKKNMRWIPDAQRVMRE